MPDCARTGRRACADRGTTGACTLGILVGISGPAIGDWLVSVFLSPSTPRRGTADTAQPDTPHVVDTGARHRSEVPGGDADAREAEITAAYRHRLAGHRADLLATGAGGHRSPACERTAQIQAAYALAIRSLRSAPRQHGPADGRDWHRRRRRPVAVTMARPANALSVPHYTGPLLTRETADTLRSARDAGAVTWSGSLDLGRTTTQATLAPAHWRWQGRDFPYPERLKDRSIHYWDGEAFAAVSRYGRALYKLVPTGWCAPTFEIDGIKMLPTAKVSPFEDARSKVALVAPRGQRVLDTCGGLGYFAACCLEAGAARILSFEKSEDVLWLRTLNPWSPDPEAPEHGGRLQLRHGDVAQEITRLPDAAFDAVLHDPPRFGIAGELYSQAFYDQLARVLRKGGRLFHYTGTPNRLTSGRDVPREVSRRLEKAGFRTQPALDGVLAQRR